MANMINSNRNGIQYVVNPNGSIPVPIGKDERLTRLMESGKIKTIIDRFLKTYKKDERGALFYYSGIEIVNQSDLIQAFNLAFKIGSASSGINPFAFSCVLTDIAAREKQKQKAQKTDFVPPFLVTENPRSLKDFEDELYNLFGKIADDSAPSLTLIPCKFNNDVGSRTHWILTAVEKQDQKTMVTYINTRGGNHEATEPPERTLLPQERIIEKAAKDVFDSKMVRNPDTSICLTTKSCGVDVLTAAERILQIDVPVDEFVSQGGLLQQDDLASSDPEKADLENRARCADHFIGFLQSWAFED